MDSTGTALGQLVWGNKAARRFYGFQEATSEPPGKAKKPTACHVMLHNTWATRVAIVSSVITRYLTVVNIGQSRFNLQIFLCSVNQFHCIGCQFLLFFISSLILIHLIPFCFVQSDFVWLFRVRLPDYSVLFSVLILELYYRNFDPILPIKNNHPASQ
jgi:hypothetical protein